MAVIATGGNVPTVPLDARLVPSWVAPAVCPVTSSTISPVPLTAPGPVPTVSRTSPLTALAASTAGPTHPPIIAAYPIPAAIPKTTAPTALLAMPAPAPALPQAAQLAPNVVLAPTVSGARPATSVRAPAATKEPISTTASAPPAPPGVQVVLVPHSVSAARMVTWQWACPNSSVSITFQLTVWGQSPAVPASLLVRRATTTHAPACRVYQATFTY